MTDKEVKAAYFEQKRDEQWGLKHEPAPACGNCRHFIRHFVLQKTTTFATHIGFIPTPTGTCANGKSRPRQRKDFNTCPEFELNPYFSIYSKEYPLMAQVSKECRLYGVAPYGMP